MTLLKKKTIQSASGFTLIELLIVIVIIGILAGVLISVINPTAQQNRARDANVKALINKVALAAQGYVSAYGSAPNDVQLLASLSSTTGASGTYSCTGSDNICAFDISGTSFPSTCAANQYQPTAAGTAACHFVYTATNAGTAPDFRIDAPSFGIALTWFEYANTGANAGILMHCTSSGCVQP